MSIIIGWLLLGLVAGFVASKIVNAKGEGVLLDTMLGIGGAVIGGFIFNLASKPSVTGFNIGSSVVAAIGAIVVLVLYHGLTGRRAL
jgi:uncharacterized membrane protein YeaQ/YmgE (transglycosylase-associated protein family)